jgi:hypothetical protein
MGQNHASTCRISGHKKCKSRWSCTEGKKHVPACGVNGCARIGLAWASESAAMRMEPCRYSRLRPGTLGLGFMCAAGDRFWQDTTRSTAGVRAGKQWLDLQAHRLKEGRGLGVHTRGNGANWYKRAPTTRFGSIWTKSPTTLQIKRQQA